MKQFTDTLKPLYEHSTNLFVVDTVTAVNNPPSKPVTMVKGRHSGKGNVMTSTMGNLSHSPKNDTRFDDLLELSAQFGIAQAQGEDVQIKHLLAVTQAAFEGVVDNTVNKHSPSTDDATRITEAYWMARNKNVIFNPKAGNQRKTISTVRQCISLGGWSKGGPGEPIGMINQAMTMYQKLKTVPDQAKRMVDAANYLITIARRMKKSDVILEVDELHDLAFKPNPNEQTVADVLDDYRKGLKKLYEGKFKGSLQCSSSNVDKAIQALNRELKAIADASRSAAHAESDQAVSESISKAADRAGDATSVSVGA